MKKSVLYTIIGIVVVVAVVVIALAVGKKNTPPTLTYLSPANNAVLPSDTTSVTLRWSATDPDKKDTVKFDVYFKEGSEPSETDKVAADIATDSYTVNVEPGKEYYWYVVAKDRKNSVKGDVQKFSVEQVVETFPEETPEATSEEEQVLPSF